MTKARQRALLKRLAAIHVPVMEIEDTGPECTVTIQGEDFAKVVALAKGGSYFTSPVGTNLIKLV